MLEEISIKNFAIIQEVSLTFEAGMTILTGETGAGKSIIIDAMMLLLGGRASGDFIRHGAEKAEIEGLFRSASKELARVLESYGLEATQELILRREVLLSGDGSTRSVCRVNGQLVTLAALREIGEFLIDIHGQHDNQELMNAKRHLAMLDEFGDAEFEQVRAAYQAIFEDYRNLRGELVQRQKNATEFAQRIEILQFQVDEIETAEIDLERDAGLNERREKLVHAKEIADDLNRAYFALEGDEANEVGGLVSVRTASDALLGLVKFDKDYEELSKRVEDAFYSLEDVAEELSKAAEDLEFNPSELTAIEERLGMLGMLKKKYGPDLSDVMAYYEGISRELSNLTGSENDLESLSNAVKEKQSELLHAADALNASRHELAKTLEADIKRELADLYMEKADFEVRFTAAKFSAHGNESVEFYIQTNPGEGFKPLAKTASGGELSRLMLAIKSSFARHENKTAIVFDEVDTGVSGRVAQAIAEKIYKIAKSGQVLAISHLPQVVAIADVQYGIEKAVAGDVTTSTVTRLNAAARVEEVAKMLAGDKVTQEARAQAKLLLSKN
ncbi:MAG: DNA repair protein RecN [Streptococcaceae bacterium]|jgi:DNA repair protein RecN (Recombination protein N)|nr:DNA repair protein RecN [Streptococcaceae bacterium]